jgi:hypothetical protein
MGVVTLLAAVQALRHESQTIGVFAWIAGYLVPAMVGQAPPGGGSTGPSALFAYLVLLSAGVFIVSYRNAWPIFTGMAVIGTYSSAAYIFRVSAGSLGWTLAYLGVVTAGMLSLATARQGRAGEAFGAVGAVAGYLVTAVVMLAGAGGSPQAPYFYLLALSAGSLWLSHTLRSSKLRWCGVLGAIVGFVLMFVVTVLFRSAGVAQWGHWLLVYAAASVAGSLAISAGKHEDAEPLAIAALIGAYGAAALLAWAAPAGAVSDGAMIAYLGALAAAILFLSARFEWASFARLGLLAAFAATVLLWERLPGQGVNYLPLMYLVMLGSAAVSLSVHLEDRVLGGISLTGLFFALPLTGLVSQATPPLLVPTYLALAAVDRYHAVPPKGADSIRDLVAGYVLRIA